MNLLADENIPSHLVRQLRGLGHDVRYAAELEPGLNDEEWLDAARHDDRTLITDDKDFGELVFRRRMLTCGVVLAITSDAACRTVDVDGRRMVENPLPTAGELRCRV